MKRRVSLMFAFLAGVALGAVFASTITLHFLLRESHADKAGLCTCPERDCICPKKDCIHDQPVHTTQSPASTTHQPADSPETSSTVFSKVNAPIELPHTSTAKGSLLVAVMTSASGLRLASSAYNSWAAEADEVVLFVGETCCSSSAGEAHGLPIVKLKGVADDSNPSFEKTAAALKYVNENYDGKYRWLLKVTDDTFVNLRQMDGFLAQVNPLQPSYIGKAESVTQNHCDGHAGVVLSTSTVNNLVPKLDHCVRTLSGPEDDVLGRCIVANVGVTCTQLYSNSIEQYSTPSPSSSSSSSSFLSSLLSDSKYHNAVVVYHVMEAEHMLLLHWYYKQEEYRLLRERMSRVERQLDGLCADLLIDNCRPSPMDTTCPPETSTCASQVAVPSPPPVSPRTIEDMVAWDFFDKGALYNDRSIHPAHSFRIMEARKLEMKALNAEVTKEATKVYGKPLRFRKIVGGYMRYNPLVGMEYIMDAMFLDRSTMNSAVHLRVRLVRPLAPNYVGQQESSDSTTTINFVVPVSRVESRFAAFLEMYENVALKNSEAARLILVAHGEEGVAFVNKVMQPYVERNTNFKFTVVKGEGNFTRARSIHLGMLQLDDAELAFVCDVDMEIKNHFFNRCRRNPVRGKRVFFPEFFKLYNLEFVNRHKDGTPPKDTIIRQYGHWAYYSYGMVCIFKSDYLAVGGMKTDIVGWGDEDVDFYERVLGKSLEVVRAPDTGLFHRWHEKECPLSLPRTQYQHCLSSKAENLADRKELASYIFELQQNKTSVQAR